jgi:hypothetical protein
MSGSNDPVFYSDTPKGANVLLFAVNCRSYRLKAALSSESGSEGLSLLFRRSLCPGPTRWNDVFYFS